MEKYGDVFYVWKVFGVRFFYSVFIFKPCCVDYLFDDRLLHRFLIASDK